MNTFGIRPLLLRAGLRYFIRHRWQALLALLGVVLGVAVVLAVDIANSAARQSFLQSATVLQGHASHRIVNPAGDVPQTLYSQLFTTPGHPPMAPVITTKVNIEGQTSAWQLLGLDIFSEAAFRPTLPAVIDSVSGLGDWLTTPQAVALGASAARQLGLVVGDQLKIGYRAQDYELTVVAVFVDDPGAMGELLLVDIATAQIIAGLGEDISYIDTKLDESQRQWLSSRLPATVELLTVEQQLQGIAGMSSAFELNLTAMSLLALLVGMFLINNAMNFAIVQRRDLLGRLRALGITSTELFAVILAEAILLAAIGTLIGCLTGIALGQHLTTIVAGTIDTLYYDVAVVDVAVSPSSLLKACILGIGGTLLASALPARQAAATRPLTTLSRSTIELTANRKASRFGLLGAAALIVGVLVAFHLPGGVIPGFIGLFIMLLGVALATPALLTFAYRALVRLPLAGTARMAISDLNRNLSRLGTAVAALTIALAASVSVAIMVDSMRGSVSVWLNDLLAADLYVTAVGHDHGAPLPDTLPTSMGDLAQVSGVSRYRGRELLLASRSLGLIAADLTARSRAGFRIRSTTSDPWRSFDAGGVLISEPLSNRLDLSAGDTLRLPTSDGQRDFHIAAVFEDYASEHGRVFIDLKHYRRLWNDHAVDSLALFAADGNDSDLRDALSAALSDDYELNYTAAGEIRERSQQVFDRTFRITEVLRHLSLLVAFVGIASALMAIQLERRREYAVLRAIGFTRRQVGILILMQSVIPGVFAGLLALPVGMLMAWVLTDVIHVRAFGWQMQYMIDAALLLATPMIGAVAAMLAAIYPAVTVARRQPASQLRGD